ncbi:hypothetical protein MKW98_003966, partial [Papaver atlanticum]
LNRCRKSCRLRWLNYLKPNIERGEFEADEVDLITRMHKLLGNRWSLIAGRVPGRTANDIKNFYNTHLKKHCFSKLILRPQPRTFSKTSQCIINKESTPITEMKNNNLNTSIAILLDDSNDHVDQLTKNSVSSIVNDLDRFSSKNVSSSDDYYCNFDDDQRLKEVGDYLNNDLYLDDDLWRLLGENQDGQYLTI